MKQVSEFTSVCAGRVGDPRASWREAQRIGSTVGRESLRKTLRPSHGLIYKYVTSGLTQLIQQAASAMVSGLDKLSLLDPCRRKPWPMDGDGMEWWVVQKHQICIKKTPRPSRSPHTNVAPPALALSIDRLMSSIKHLTIFVSHPVRGWMTIRGYPWMDIIVFTSLFILFFIIHFPHPIMTYVQHTYFSSLPNLYLLPYPWVVRRRSRRAMIELRA
jgi:hypothetical protein